MPTSSRRETARAPAPHPYNGREAECRIVGVFALTPHDVERLPRHGPGRVACGPESATSHATRLSTTIVSPPILPDGGGTCRRRPCELGVPVRRRAGHRTECSNVRTPRPERFRGDRHEAGGAPLPKHVSAGQLGVRGGFEPPTFRFSGAFAGPAVSLTGRMIR